MKRIIEAVRRWWYGDNHGVHARPRRHVEFIDLTQATITRKPTFGRPPWETAPFPAICLMPIYEPEPLHPVVQAVVTERLGASSISEYVSNLFGPVWDDLWKVAV